ncbi:chromosomal replication initiator protein DnaA [Segnochrobactraceae bacterium EtOH-i3]
MVVDEAACWPRVRDRLRAELGPDVFESWFSRVDLEGVTGALVRLSVPTRFLKQWIQTHYLDQVAAIWRAETGSERRIDITMRGAARSRAAAAVVAEPLIARTPVPPPATLFSGLDDYPDSPVRASAPPPRPVARAVAPVARPQPEHASDGSLSGSPLDPRFTFDSFVEGRSNGLALAAARQIATARPTDPVVYNPLYIHAPVGLGKTHLIQAIGSEARRAVPGRRVLALTAEHFMFRFVAALKTQSAMAFKESLRAIDLLIIDDLQFLHGDKVQEEFCHTLNTLIDGGRQVVVAADRPPVELETFDSRVRSRLGGGLAVEIAPPDYDMRRQIIARRLAVQRQTHPGLEVPEAVLDFVARSITSNGRDLDGAMTRLVAHNQLTGAPITVEMAETALRDLLRGREVKRVRIEDIQRVVSLHYQVSRADLVSARRTRVIVRPRQIAMYLAKTLTLRSLPEIGRRFGGRDHTTVLHAVRKIEGELKTDAALADDMETLKRMLDD